MTGPNWMLPEGVEEILPAEAAQLEQLRRQILDDLAERGFSLVMPPVMEFVDSLLVGTGEELDTQTYKFMDQHTHRMLGIRADMTPQIARLDAHYLNENEINRLCYAGTVLRTQPDQMGGQRELLQIGAEIFGVDSTSADLEVIDAMLATLDLSAAKEVTISLGHVGIYRELIKLSGADSAVQSQIFDALLRKSRPDLDEMSSQPGLEPLLRLLQLQGGSQVLKAAQTELPTTPSIQSAVHELEEVIEHIKLGHKNVQLHIDLADVFGYRYHTGLKFSVFVKGRGRTIAKGGRYDRIGEHFGRARPATGFSADLKALNKLA